LNKGHYNIQIDEEDEDEATPGNENELKVNTQLLR